MKFANNISIRVFCKCEENEDKIVEGLYKISGFSKEELGKEKLKIIKTEAKGFDEKIKIFELVFVKDRHVNKVLKNLKEKLNKKDKEFLKTQDDRLDENLDFYIRLLKPEILKDFFELTDSGDCYHIKINIASFPKNKNNAKKIIDEIF